MVPPPSTIGAPPTAGNRSVKGITSQKLYVLTAHQESEHNERAHICRYSCRNSEDDKEQIARMVQGQTSIHFRQRCNDCHVSISLTGGIHINVLKGPKLKPRT
jgi:hypothetical protein